MIKKLFQILSGSKRTNPPADSNPAPGKFAMEKEIPEGSESKAREVDEDLEPAETHEKTAAAKKVAAVITAAAEKNAEAENTRRVAVIGDEGNGKTTLLTAILKILSQDGLAAAIDYSVLDYSTPCCENNIVYNRTTVEFDMKNHHYIFTEFPNYKEWFKGAVCRCELYNAVLLVADAAGGFDSKFFTLCREMYMLNMTVFINKTELVHNDEILELTTNYYAETLDGYVHSLLSVFRGSAQKALEGRSSDEAAIRSMLKCLDEAPDREPDICRVPCNIFKASVYMLPENETSVKTTFYTDEICQIQICGREYECKLLIDSLSDECSSGDFTTMMITLCPNNFKQDIYIEQNRSIRFSLMESGRSVGVGYVSEILS